MLAIYLAMLETEEDQRRFIRLYETYEKKVYAVALRILGDPTRAEDAAQQTWFRLLKNWERVSALAWEETEGDTLTFIASMTLENYLEKPELTFHIENMAIYEDGKGNVTWDGDRRTGPGPGETLLKGPFDFTFTLENALLPVKYTGDVGVTVTDIPFRLKGVEISPLDLDFEYEIQALVDNRKPDEVPKPGKLDGVAVTKTLHKIVQGLWTKDGKYVDLSQNGGAVVIGTPKDGSGTYGSVGSNLPFPVDPAMVTAVKLGETRVELSELTPVTEQTARK